MNESPEGGTWDSVGASEKGRVAGGEERGESGGGLSGVEGMDEGGRCSGRGTLSC